MARRIARTERLDIRRPAVEDEVAFIAAAARSRSLHAPWLEAPTDADAYAAYRARIRRRPHHGFLLQDASTGDLAGVTNISDVILGAFRSAHLSYYAFTGHEGRGVMTEGLRWTIDHAFDTLGLHRLEANIQPANTRSIDLVQRCGLTLEGFSPRYLKVDGDWRDHERWAITVEDRDADR